MLNNNNKNEISDIIDYKIIGDDIQLVEIELDPKEGVVAEAGVMCYMDTEIEMQTSTQMTKENKGLMSNIWSGVKRAFAGESFFITTFVHTGNSDKKKIGFAAPYPGKIIPIDLSKFDQEFICQKDAFLCAANGTDVTVHLNKKIGAGLFGGEGFILQKIKGDGLAFVHAGGTIIKRELKPEETLKIDTGCLVGMSTSVDYDIKFVGGFKNALFGGEGVFYATVKGPGTVYLQSLPFSRLADRLMAAQGHFGRKGETSLFNTNLFGGN